MVAYAQEMLFLRRGKEGDEEMPMRLIHWNKGRFCSSILFPRLRGAEVFEGYGVAMLLAPDQVIQL